VQTPRVQERVIERHYNNNDSGFNPWVAGGLGYMLGNSHNNASASQAPVIINQQPGQPVEQQYQEQQVQQPFQENQTAFNNTGTQAEDSGLSGFSIFIILLLTGGLGYFVWRLVRKSS
jgi:hypothetical protein